MLRTCCATLMAAGSMDADESTTIHSGESRSTDSRSCASELATSTSQPHTLSASLKRAGGGSFCVNTTAFCNTRASCGYVAPSPNGHFYIFLVGPSAGNGLWLQPCISNFLWVVPVVRRARKAFL